MRTIILFVETKERLALKAKRVLGDGILDILTTVPRLEIDRLKRRNIFGGVSNQGGPSCLTTTSFDTTAK